MAIKIQNYHVLATNFALLFPLYELYCENKIQQWNTHELILLLELEECRKSWLEP